MRLGRVWLAPGHWDRRVARGVARIARPGMERGAGWLTLLADEHLLLALAGAAWMGTRLGGSRRARRQADHLALATAVTAGLPHLVKQVVNRKRPNRVVLTAPWQGVPRQGKPDNSFPSGHAMHLGASASALARWVPRRWRWVPWAAALSLGSTRVLLLAHWPSDVALGFAAGVGVERLLARVEARGLPHTSGP